MLITGLDEAGRGAVIGPLVVAGVTIDKNHEKKLIKLGVKDSKQLTPKRREELAGEIEKLASSIIVMRIRACKIDNYRAKKINLDKIEAMKMAEVIEMSNGGKVFVDALSINPKRFRNLVLSYMRNKKVDLVAENFADQNYPVVSAASIIAKVERDKAIRKLEERVGEPLGVGYPHDETTVAYIEKLIKQRKKLPSFVRQSWITTQMLKEKNWQRKIKDFFRRK